MSYFNYGQIEIDYLTQRDAQLGSAIAKIGLIQNEVIPDLFTALIKSIVEQQISSKAADTVWRRLCEKLSVINASNMVNTDISELQRCGLSLRKAGYMHNIAYKTLSGELDFVALSQLSNEQFIKTLSSLSGVGIWTAEMLLIFSLSRLDVVSWGDLAIRRGMINLYGLSELTKVRFMHYRDNYSPYGSVASLYLWELADSLKS
jgi:DNA-3-methyladenine glycosylase II